MLKVKKIKIKGFRGILDEQTFELPKGNSIVIFGLNSNGKSSIVDGMEWFFSKKNEISLLTREDAKEKAYPHVSLSTGDSYVEITLLKDKNELYTLRKSHNFKAPTKPLLSDEKKFDEIYKMYVIPPYLRYSDIAKFVLSSKTEKYISLANWMGFDYILNYQERLRLTLEQISQEVDRISQNVDRRNDELQILISTDNKITNIIDYINISLNKYNIDPISSINEIDDVLDKIKKLLPDPENSDKYNKLTNLENYLSKIVFSETLLTALNALEDKINKQKENNEEIQKLEQINLYKEGLDFLLNHEENTVNCPLCGLVWGSKEELIAHIKSELQTLASLKEQNEDLNRSVINVLQMVDSEIAYLIEISREIAKVKEKFEEKDYQILKLYKKTLLDFSNYLHGQYLKSAVNCPSAKDLDIPMVKEEVSKLIAITTKQEKQLNLPEKYAEILSDYAKISRLIETYKTYTKEAKELEFIKNEFKKIYDIKEKIVDRIKKEIEERFGSISEKVQKYFKILRPDKNINNIKIDLVDRTKGSNKSAELSLDFYDTSISPAYKILSESLLNSLGLSIYLSCLKTYNTQCSFIVLDDIINSLDSFNRENVIKLFKEEFKDYQLFILTHDDIWFDRLKSNFNNWEKYKILDWSFEKGPIFSLSGTTQQEIETLLADPQNSRLAGNRLGEHMEDILNILCENLEAEVKHRYKKDIPFCLGELFDSVMQRLNILKEINLHQEANLIKNDEIFLRNYSSHNRKNFSSSLNPEEIRTFVKKWFAFQNKITCLACNTIISYTKKGKYKKIECDCGKLKINLQNG